MATRISFMTHYPARMKELAGKPTRFPEKIIAGLIRADIGPDGILDLVKGTQNMHHHGYDYDEGLTFAVNPKTTTIRENYEYWKSKEGQLLQPFFWAGKPYRSKQVVFCPEVLLRRVQYVWSFYVAGRNIFIGDEKGDEVPVYIDDSSDLNIVFGERDLMRLAQNEGFDHPDHFWMWFDKDMDGALLELESVGG